MNAPQNIQLLYNLQNRIAVQPMNIYEYENEYENHLQAFSICVNLLYCFKEHTTEEVMVIYLN